jgi:KDO2-lipid IV(A) lauroyltransferase
MSAIGFYVQYIFLRTIAFLPFWMLFIISDCLYFFMYYVVRYRHKVVKENIKRAFPGRSEKERQRIEKGFYRHFGDLIIESLKMIHMSPEQLSKRIPLINPEILDKFRDSGRSIMAVGAHYGNWEWTLGIVHHLNYKTIGVYKPLNNKRFDSFANKIRSKFGAEFVSMREVIRALIKYKNQKTPTFNVFVADQSPVWEEIQYWTPFLNQQTAVYLGPEKIAKQFNMVVLFGKVNKTARGRYTVEFIPLEENPLNTSEFEITKKFIGVLEELIIDKPEYWLWSHRRWKLTRKRENEEGRGIFRFSENNTRI